MTIEDGIIAVMLVMLVTTVLWLRMRGRAQRRDHGSHEEGVVERP